MLPYKPLKLVFSSNHFSIIKILNQIKLTIFKPNLSLKKSIFCLVNHDMRPISIKSNFIKLKRIFLQFEVLKIISNFIK